MYIFLVKVVSLGLLDDAAAIAVVVPEDIVPRPTSDYQIEDVIARFEMTHSRRERGDVGSGLGFVYYYEYFIVRFGDFHDQRRVGSGYRNGRGVPDR
jgi:hypothetical protein